MANRKKHSNLQRLLYYIIKATKTPKGCWEYQPKKYNSYIHFKTRGCEYFTTNSTMLHRFVYAVYNDQHLSQQDVIMHTCDNKICINPLHLKLGTINENNQDRARKLRAKKRKKDK